MRYASLEGAVRDLEKQRDLVRIREEVDPDLEMAAIHRRVQEAGGPAIFYERVKGSPFPAVSNLFGTLERARFLFRDTLAAVRTLVEAKADPAIFLKRPSRLLSLPQSLGASLPIRKKTGPVLACETRVSSLPAVRCWPEDGGPFVLLPQVLSEDPEKPGIFSTNLGMYRVQLSGNDYIQDEEVGLHYQIRRDIGIHHTKAAAMGKRLPVSIFAGGPPAHTLAAVMPLPEGLSELVFAGALGGRNFRYARRGDHIISLDADFCITGYVAQGKKPEGPFGDHLGYYSLVHDFPYLEDVRVFHRKNAIWPFTVVGRPPAEDTVFGQLIHDITAPMVPVSLPGVAAVHAVDAAGVHPLLLAIGHERFEPRTPRPMELLTQASAILGFGHCSLAKYLFIVAKEDAPNLDIHNIPSFFAHVLERVDWSRDLHFHTRTTMDTLDYSGDGVNQGSKLVVAACGPVRRRLGTRLPDGFSLPSGLDRAALVMPGILAVSGGVSVGSLPWDAEELAVFLGTDSEFREAFPLILLVDDADFVARREANWLWVTFTRSDPAKDVHGGGSFIHNKHWGCTGPLLIDARIKGHHAPGLETDPAIEKRVDALAAKGGPLYGLV
ncbi:4-hydroxy-3-polyprenylbenzoate decarboxylase [Desulfobotulus alkaliphilus]|uniref:4-hydroxy-3-polyprenylbenzoate decarboxylase n=1 Tax=Desulfobotulus alkaliphilus TaxID=622671 RepID=A0A562RMJ9_9BACT|nr:UbiD family decarboxylase [Desulfobotulus alkaliphilus]TWI70288.1 4-hydroxy-3-polyprenylbenzoate decarboxylase [Desulfobotulus alkaliphilus]